MSLELDDSVGEVAGVGPARAEELRAAGILTVGDLLSYLPMRYEDRSVRTPVSDLRPGMRTGVDVEVLSVRRKGRPGPRRATEAMVADDTGEALAIWFNQPYMATRFEKGDRAHLFGPVDEYKGAIQLINPVAADNADSPHLGRPVPIYRRIGSLGPGILRRLVSSALDQLAADQQRLPAEVTTQLGLIPMRDALRELHYPPTGADLALWEDLRSDAHRALAMAELIDFQTVLGLQRQRDEIEPGIARLLTAAAVDGVVSEFPFTLTEAQSRVLREVCDDLSADYAMHRLVQGDVGCGKTAVLGAAALAVALQGEQVAVLAPTEILARQHSVTLGTWGAALGVDVLTLLGADPKPTRAAAAQRLREGGPLLVVGTHALLQDSVEFERLGLVVIDEQHRFGVGQRAALRAKGRLQGTQPDLLVTTATPIPRSLALTIYGDLDVSRIDEMPPGRSPVATRRLERDEWPTLIDRLRAVIESDARAFVVAPAIESEEDGPETLATVQAVAKRLSEELGSDVVAILHGRQDSETRESTIEDFSQGKRPVLVATTVIEVGLDIPAATLMVVVQAERFGLAQLHQLRGRVGRGERNGECWLMVSSDITPTAAARIETLCETNDGFVVAESDLELRGAGELLGYRQTGPFGFRIANPRLHADWLRDAHQVALELARVDTTAALEYRERLRSTWRTRTRLARAG